MFLSSYLKIYPYPEKPGGFLLYSTRRASLILVPASTLHAIEAGTLSAADRETLARLGMLVPDPALEKEEMRLRFDEANRRRRKFSAVVVLNLDCNLACTYCYEGSIRGKRYMSAETADLLVEVIERDHLARGKKVALDFYGGEALLSTGLIKSISGRLQKSAQAEGLDYSFNIVTNGTLLTRPVAQELAVLGMQGAKFTLDGPRDIHDSFRPFVSGKGSFAAIIDNLKSVCDVIKVQVGGNYTRDNYREFPRLLDSLLAEGLTPARLSLVAQAFPTSNRGAIAPASRGSMKRACFCAKRF
ncbi:MAG: hypothetical protein FD174_2778 [Geobacteraceae bacterium]|nr:MAG: hypothetical protein FD174_2778 [Geobacteraceae bacterium]